MLKQYTQKKHLPPLCGVVLAHLCACARARISPAATRRSAGRAQTPRASRVAAAGPPPPPPPQTPPDSRYGATSYTWLVGHCWWAGTTLLGKRQHMERLNHAE